MDSLWSIDSIHLDGQLFLSRVNSFRYDTISNYDFKKYSRKHKKEYRKKWEQIKSIYKNDSIYLNVYRQVEILDKKDININDVKYIQYSKYYKCDKEYKESKEFAYWMIAIGGVAMVCSPFTTLPVAVFVLAAINTNTGYYILKRTRLKTFDLKEWKYKIK